MTLLKNVKIVLKKNTKTSQERKREKNKYVEMGEWNRRFKEHKRFTVIAKKIKSLTPFSPEEVANTDGELNQSLVAWSQGALIVQESRNVTVLIDRVHLQTFYYKGNLKYYLNTPLEVEVATILILHRHIYVVLTRRPELTDIYNSLVEAGDNSVFTAKVVHYTSWGAFLKYKDLRINLRNTEVSPDSKLAVRDVLKVGDEVAVHPFMHDDDHVILFVKTAQPFNFDEKDYISKLSEGEELVGTVRKWTPNVCYIRLAPGVDALANYPNGFEINNGTKVWFKITKIKENGNILRGKVLKPIDTYSEEIANHASVHTKLTEEEKAKIKEEL